MDTWLIPNQDSSFHISSNVLRSAISLRRALYCTGTRPYHRIQEDCPFLTHFFFSSYASKKRSVHLDDFTYNEFDDAKRFLWNAQFRFHAKWQCQMQNTAWSCVPILSLNKYLFTYWNVYVFQLYRNHWTHSSGIKLHCIGSSDSYLSNACGMSSNVKLIQSFRSCHRQKW